MTDAGACQLSSGDLSSEAGEAESAASAASVVLDNYVPDGFTLRRKLAPFDNELDAASLCHAYFRRRLSKNAAFCAAMSALACSRAIDDTR